MAALLIAGSIAAVDHIREKRRGKRRSTATASLDSPSSSTNTSPTSPTSDASHTPPPSYPSTNLHEDLSVAEEKERLRLQDSHAAQHPANANDEEVPAYEPGLPHEEATAPPAYEAPPYNRHRSDTLLESSQPRGRSHRPSQGLFPRAHTLSNALTASLATDVVAESSDQAREMESQGRTKCVVGPDGRCACGKRERSPNAPLGETVKERRERKWKERFDFSSPGFWGLVGVSLASHGNLGRVYDDRTQFRYWAD